MRATVILFFISCFVCFSQKVQSKGDLYFFQYSYKQAITEYEKDLNKGALSENQYLNLADSYYNVGSYKKAKDTYIKVFSTDSIMSNHQFNKMLQSLNNTQDFIKADSIFKSKKEKFSKELSENTFFNKELLNSKLTNNLKYQIFNLESNSSTADFSPTFYKDKLLFTSGRPKSKRQGFSPSGQAYLDIFEGKPNAKGQVPTAIKFTQIENSNYHKATPYFAKELNSHIYVLSNTSNGDLLFDDNGKNALAIGMQPQNGKFRFLLRDLSTSFYYPFYDGVTGKLYFSANFDEGYGGTDIYFVYTNHGQIMSAPINLGPRINSPANEIAPYIFENSLYFSSDIFYGFGGMDIYKSNMEEDMFSIPVNLGKEINSGKDDFGFIIKNNEAGFLGYFSSNRVGGKGDDDIYGFLVNKKPGLKTLSIHGKVIEAKGRKQGVSNASIRLLKKDGSLIREMSSNANGTYRFEIPWEEEVLLEVSKERYSYTREVILTKDNQEKTNFDLDIELSLYDDLVEDKEGQKVIKLKDFFFQKGRSTITPEIAMELDKVVAVVKSFPNVQLRIETYTDSRGNSSTNLKISQARSNAIKDYLKLKEIPEANIIKSIGYGEDKIVNDCADGVYCLEFMHKKNQRSLIVILNDKDLFQ